MSPIAEPATLARTKSAKPLQTRRYTTLRATKKGALNQPLSAMGKRWRMPISTGIPSSAASGTRRAAAMNVGRTARPHGPPVRLCSIRFAMPPSARPRNSNQAKRYELISGLFKILDARVLRELQRADVGDDRPAVLGRDAVGVRPHDPVAVRHHVVEVPDRK